ncbi:DMT family transporter [uncultured Draconibacterium sp.]|uniref:DMT family transporter n=1 Tax=uncultured Draconibacterium sp. TaxID=1573823 RepID=UPI002AA71F46|nr:DMT family transporter [uncultured Draconibacterium sp.]
MKNKDLLAILSALAAVFFWSFSFVWFKIAFLAYKPITVVLFRLAISAILIIIMALSVRQLQKIKKEDYKWFFFMAFFEPFLYFLGESYGLKYVSSTVAAVIVATIPLFTPIATWIFYKEKVKLMTVIGIIFSFFGVGLVVMNGQFGFEASPLGVALESMAVIAAIGFALILKKLTSDYNTLTIIAYQNIIGVLLFLPIWLSIDFQDFMQTPFHPQAFRAIILLAVFSSTLAFVFFTKSLRVLGVTRANTFINLIPVFVAVMAYFILKDELRLQQIIGIIVVVTGLFLSQIKKRGINGRKKGVEIHRK